MPPSFSFEQRHRPVLKWAGGKSQLLPQLMSFFPQRFERLVEPFVGAGAVFLSLSPAIPCAISDANAELVNMYRILRDDPQGLMNILDQYVRLYSEDFYYTLRQAEEVTPLAQAARTIFLNKTGFNGLYRQNSQGKFNVPWGKRRACPALYNRENILGVSARLQFAHMEHRDFQSAIDRCGEGDFIYCDPPYEPLSSTSFTAYKAGGFSQAQQIELKNACVRAAERGALVAISNSSAPFIQELYQHYDIKFLKAARPINSKGTGRGHVDEVLVRLF